MIANPQHLSKDDSWCTPPYITHLADLVLNGIDFDPASSEDANEIVGAKDYLSEDGLTAEWEPGSIYLNPPGGKIGNQSSAVTWWVAMMERRERSPQFTHGIFMGFSLEILQTSQDKGVKDLLEFPMCVPSRRIRFLSTTKEEQKSPTHSQVISYVPGSEDHTERFMRTFSRIGSVKP
jgi:hypothetical protein